MKPSKITLALGMTCFFGLAACKRDLSRGEALSKVQAAHQSTPIIFDIYARVTPGAPTLDPILELANRNVVVCQEEKDEAGPSGLLVTCVPGPGGELQTNPRNSSDLQFNAGAIVPREVTGLTRTSDSSSEAIVRYEFEPTPLFQKHQDVWVRIAPDFQQQIQPRLISVQFQLFDDGWRIVR